MDGSDHRKFLVLSKSKTPHCLHKKYKMQVKDMAVDWYISKNAWMTGEVIEVIEMNLNERWWDRWFVVADLAINILLHDYSYFSISPMYLLTDEDVEKKQFFVRKLRRNLQGFWSKLHMIGVTDDLGGLFSKVQK